MKTSRQSVQQMLRLPDDMLAELRAHAERNNRTMNAEIVSRLEQSLGSTGDQAVLDLLNRIASKIDA